MATNTKDKAPEERPAAKPQASGDHVTPFVNPPLYTPPSQFPHAQFEVVKGGEVVKNPRPN